MATQNDNANPNPAQPGNAAPTDGSQLAMPTIGEQHQEPTYVGSYKTREEAEAAIADLSKTRDDFTKFQQEASAREQRMQDMLDRMIGGQPVAQAPAAVRPDDLSALVSALPDPVEKPNEFKAGLVGLVQKAADTVVTAKSGESAKMQRLNGVYEDFKRQYPDLAKYNRIVDSVSRDEGARMAERGQDPYQAITADPDRFMERIARLTRAELEAMGIRPGDQGQNGDQRPDPMRTAGIPGGTQVYPNPQNGSQPASSFIGEIKDLQRAKGLI